MPRKVDPGTIRTGSGKAVPDESYYTLGGVSPLGPAIGGGEYDGPQPPDGGGSAGLDSHVHDPQGAHPATAISTSPYPDLLLGTRNVQMALDALSAGVCPQPSMLGMPDLAHLWLSVPSWGSLDLGDGNFMLYDQSFLPYYPGYFNSNTYPAGNNEAEVVAPYYFTGTAPTMGNLPAIPLIEAIFGDSDSPESADNPTGAAFVQELPDATVWNTDDVLGGGLGLAHAGGFTDTDGSVRRTTNIVPRQTGSAAPWENFSACLLGNIFPADQGVLALIHWPHGGGVTEFLAQDLLDRVGAALLMGQGITGGDCIQWDPSVGAPTVCDGDPGGIFAVGTDDNGNYDPMAYPGQASGQYNLNEIHTGISIIDPAQLPAPWNDYDGDGTVGAARQPNARVPAPGQVRLGTMEAAITGETPVDPYGIPILGATQDAYADYAIHADVVDEHYAIGMTFIESSNFFAYRLPVASAYNKHFGIRNTPRGLDPLTTRETARYFVPLPPFNMNADDFVYEEEEGSGVYYLTSAGLYTWFSFRGSGGVRDLDTEEEIGLFPQDLPFMEDQWNWQLAKYRHSFFVPDSGDGGSTGCKGSFWLLHFKTEGNFEKFVRDGIMPWDASDGYELYGAYPQSGIEDYKNVVNEDTDSQTSPRGPAPYYGYNSLGYFLNKNSVFVTDEDYHDDIEFSTHEWDWADGGVTMMQCSGVWYFNPLDITTGTPHFTLDTLEAQVDGGAGGANPWTEAYRVDDNPLTADANPAQLSSPNPAFLFMGQFAYGTETGSSDPTMTVTPGFTDARGERLQRIEFPFNYLGSFTEANGPDFADDLVIELAGGETIVPTGDQSTPAFSTNARPRAFVRRPLVSGSTEYAVQPAYTTALGSGQALDEAGGRQVLFHTTRFNVGGGGGDGDFGNYITGFSPSPAYASLGSARKDIEERFLDEVYRIKQNFGGILTADGGDQLRGPGMAAWAGGFIETPIRVGHTVDGTWIPASWVQQDCHTDNTTVMQPELQVAGLPDRCPPVTDWGISPMPSSGLLLYPVTDYSSGYSPSMADYPLAQPDFSSCTGTREYIRAFDMRFSESGTEEEVVNRAFATLRFHGLIKEDFQYSPPGPGGISSGIAIMAKVPGLTTWMDVGRFDGEGPSKQDPILDGAGCLVDGEYTYDKYTADTGIRYAQVRIHVGPLATFQQNSDDTVPLLIKVIMRDPAGAWSNSDKYDFNHEYEDMSGWTGETGPGISSSKVRGLTTIEVIRESEKQSINPSDEDD